MSRKEDKKSQLSLIYLVFRNLANNMFELSCSGCLEWGVVLMQKCWHSLGQQLTCRWLAAVNLHWAGILHVSSMMSLVYVGRLYFDLSDLLFQNLNPFIYYIPYIYESLYILTLYIKISIISMFSSSIKLRFKIQLSLLQ